MLCIYTYMCFLALREGALEEGPIWGFNFNWIIVKPIVSYITHISDVYHTTIGLHTYIYICIYTYVHTLYVYIVICMTKPTTLIIHMYVCRPSRKDLLYIYIYVYISVSLSLSFSLSLYIHIYIYIYTHGLDYHLTSIHIECKQTHRIQTNTLNVNKHVEFQQTMMKTNPLDFKMLDLTPLAIYFVFLCYFYMVI